MLYVQEVETMTEAHVDSKATDGYLLCLFCVDFTTIRFRKPLMLNIYSLEIKHYIHISKAKLK